MNVVIRRGTEADLDGFIHLLQQVQKEMPHPEWFYVDPPDVFRQLFDSGKMVFWMAMDGDRPAAALDILVPGMEKYNYGYELAFSARDLMQVVHMDSAAVAPEYRGLGLQRQLLARAEDWLGREEDRILLCTVHPENIYSLNNALSSDYAVQKQIRIYQSERLLLRKNILKK